VKVLSSKSYPAQLRLEAVICVSAFVLFSAPCTTLLSKNIVDHVVGIFKAYPDDLDVQTQCLFCFYRLICHSTSRKSLVAHREIVNAIVQHTSSRNPVVVDMANSVLDTLVTFDASWQEIIKQPRFVAFNHEWLEKMGIK
jgi:hypothetical protein